MVKHLLSVLGVATFVVASAQNPFQKTLDPVYVVGDFNNWDYRTSQVELTMPDINDDFVKGSVDMQAGQKFCLYSKLGDANQNRLAPASDVELDKSGLTTATLGEYSYNFVVPEGFNGLINIVYYPASQNVEINCMDNNLSSYIKINTNPYNGNPMPAPGDYAVMDNMAIEFGLPYGFMGTNMLGFTDGNVHLNTRCQTPALLQYEGGKTLECYADATMGDKYEGWVFDMSTDQKGSVAFMFWLYGELTGDEHYDVPYNGACKLIIPDGFFIYGGKRTKVEIELEDGEIAEIDVFVDGYEMKGTSFEYDCQGLVVLTGEKDLFETTSDSISFESKAIDYETTLAVLNELLFEREGDDETLQAIVPMSCAIKGNGVNAEGSDKVSATGLKPGTAYQVDYSLALNVPDEMFWPFSLEHHWVVTTPEVNVTERDGKKVADFTMGNGAKLRYTLDGSDPTGPKAIVTNDKSVELSGLYNLRAVAFAPKSWAEDGYMVRPGYSKEIAISCGIVEKKDNEDSVVSAEGKMSANVNSYELADHVSVAVRLTDGTDAVYNHTSETELLFEDLKGASHYELTYALLPETEATGTIGATEFEALHNAAAVVKTLHHVTAPNPEYSVNGKNVNVTFGVGKDVKVYYTTDGTAPVIPSAAQLRTRAVSGTKEYVAGSTLTLEDHTPLSAVAVSYRNETPLTSEAYSHSDVTTSVSEIGAEGVRVRYFNLQGQEISRPEEGVYIRVNGGKAEKVAE